jgi:hypothetical protein
MQTLPTDYSHEQLVDALCAEWDWLCHDDCLDDDLSPEDYRAKIVSLTHAQLIDETGTDEDYTIQEFMHAYS